MKRISIIKLILFLLLATGIFSCTKIPLIADLFYWHTTVFFNNDCNYSKIRISETRLDPDEISSSIPEGSTVYFNFKKNKEAFVDMRYLLYPVKVKSYDSTSNISQPGSYLIDFTDSLYKSFPFLLLKTGQHLIDAGHSGFSTNKTLQAIPPLYARILSFLLLSLFYVLIGALFLKLLKFKATGLLHLLTCAYMSGFLINTIILGIEIISGCLFTQFLVVITCCSTLLILIAANRFNLKNIFVFEQTPKVENAGNSRLYKVHLTSVLLLLFFIVAINLVRPVIDMGDATSFWMLKSKIIFHEQSFIFSDVHKNEYPILLPLSVAANYALMNGMTDEIAMWGVSIFFVCLLNQIYAAVVILSKEKTIALIAVLIFILFYFYPGINCVPTGDQLLMVFLTISAFQALLYTTTKQNNHLFLSFFFAVGLTLTKQEGFIYSIIIGFLILFFTFTSYKNAKPVIIFIAFSLLFLLTWCWKLYMAHKGYFKDFADFRNEPITVYKIYKLIKVQMLNISNSDFQKGIITGIIFVFAIISKKLHSKEVQFLFFIIFLSLVFTFVSILPWSSNNMINYSWTAIPRLATQSSPLLIMLLCLLCKDHILQIMPNRK